VLSIKEAVIDLINDVNKRKKIGENAEMFIAENVAWEKNANKLSNILTEIKQKTLRS
jgi:glycosyltransferase involved in cell wall biosynthesis